MLRVGLTGNMGSGKTLVCRIFETLGIPVFRADEAGHAALEDSAIKMELLNRFGSNILNPEGTLNRKALARIVFKSAEDLEYLASLIHPMVRQSFDAWCTQHHEAPFVIHEAAILFESGFDRFFDRIIFVSAPKAVCMERVMHRDGVSQSEFMARAARQWPEEKKIPLSHYVIQNDGIAPIIPQVFDIWKSLIKS